MQALKRSLLFVFPCSSGSPCAQASLDTLAIPRKGLSVGEGVRIGGAAAIVVYSGVHSVVQVSPALP